MVVLHAPSLDAEDDIMKGLWHSKLQVQVLLAAEQGEHEQEIGVTQYKGYARQPKQVLAVVVTHPADGARSARMGVPKVPTSRSQLMGCMRA